MFVFVLLSARGREKTDTCSASEPVKDDDNDGLYTVHCLPLPYPTLFVGELVDMSKGNLTCRPTVCEAAGIYSV